MANSLYDLLVQMGFDPYQGEYTGSEIDTLLGLTSYAAGSEVIHDLTTDVEAAKEAAEDAADRAEDAADRAEAAVSLAFGAYPVDTASGEIVSIPDGADDTPVKSAEIAINPVQDFHGQANPYPAGGGKNKFDITAYRLLQSGWTLSNGVLSGQNCNYTSYASMGFVGSGNNVTLSLKYTAEKANTYYAQCYDLDNNAELWRQNLAVGTSTLTKTFSVPVGVNYEIRFVGNSATSGSLTISDVQLEEGSTATDFAPYENICPIEGWTCAKLHKYGLPNGYVEADYLRLQGTRVDIPISLARNDAIVTTQFRYNGRKQYAIVYSQYQSEAKNCTRLIQTESESANNNFYLNNNSKESAPHTLSITANAWHTLISAYSMRSLDGDVVSLSPTNGTASTATTLQIGYGNVNVTQDFRRFDIDSGVGPLLSLIPCTAPNGNVGFYDAVSDTFYAAIEQNKATAVDTPANIVKRIGKQVLLNFCINQWDEVWESGGIDGSTGLDIVDNTAIRTKNYIPCVGGKSYYCKSPDTMGLRFYDENKQFLSTANGTNRVVVFPSNAVFVRFYVANTTTYGDNISINYPATITGYYPSTGQSIVYGGSIESLGGGMYRITVNMATRDMGGLSFAAGSGNIFYVSGVDAWMTLPESTTTPANILCSAYKTVRYSIGSSEDCTVYTSWKTAGTKALYVHDTAYSDAATFNAAMSGVQLVYELVTPITFDVTADELATLLGNNVIWADTGDIALTYRADTTLYINKKIAEVTNG